MNLRLHILLCNCTCSYILFYSEEKSDAASKRLEIAQQVEELDEKYGFERLKLPCKRLGWLINMAAVSDTYDTLVIFYSVTKYLLCTQLRSVIFVLFFCDFVLTIYGSFGSVLRQF